MSRNDRIGKYAFMFLRNNLRWYDVVTFFRYRHTCSTIVIIETMADANDTWPPTLIPLKYRKISRDPSSVSVETYAGKLTGICRRSDNRIRVYYTCENGTKRVKYMYVIQVLVRCAMFLFVNGGYGIVDIADLYHVFVGEVLFVHKLQLQQSHSYGFMYL